MCGSYQAAYTRSHVRTEIAVLTVISGSESLQILDDVSWFLDPERTGIRKWYTSGGIFQPLSIPLL